MKVGQTVNENNLHPQNNTIFKEGRWEPYIKYIEKNYIGNFLCMYSTDKNLLSTMALNDCYETSLLT